MRKFDRSTQDRCLTEQICSVTVESHRLIRRRCEECPDPSFGGMSGCPIVPLVDHFDRLLVRRASWDVHEMGQDRDGPFHVPGVVIRGRGRRVV
jgi:hypothetical protein